MSEQKLSDEFHGTDQSYIEWLELSLDAQMKATGRLQWAVRMVLRDFDELDSPELSLAAVRAIQSVRTLAAQQEQEE